jgi:hypothetical protein
VAQLLKDFPLRDGAVPVKAATKKE